MMIDEKRWSEIIAEVEGSIARWNATAAARGLKDRFFCVVESRNPDNVALFTQHLCGKHLIATKVVARLVGTGELRPAKMVTRKGLTGYVIKPTPKAWTALADKNAAEIVKRLRLTDFFVPISSTVVEANNGAPI